jgi:EmrB/QacA subfamily drug resistance transporter
VTATGGTAALVEGAAGRGARSKRLALLTISLAQLMFLLDSTIVNVSLPTIQSSMRFSGSALEWMVSGYSLAFGGLLLLGGRSGDLLGRRRMLTYGVALFTGASLLGGCAQTAWWLVACRMLQGVGAAGAYPAALALVASTFAEGRARNRALGVFTSVGQAGNAGGLLVGGLITTYLSWRWVLFVNVPIGLFVLWVAPRVLDETPRKGGRFDLAGALTGTLGLGLVVYSLINSATGQDGRAHWHDTGVLVGLGAAIALVVAFVLVERSGRNPLVPLRIFADRTRSGSCVVQMMQNIAMFGLFFFMTLFLQRVWGYSPLRTALVYLPLTTSLVLMSQLSSRLVTRVGARNLVLCGLVIAAVGTAWLSRLGTGGGYASGMLVPSLLTYLGFGMTTVPLTAAALAKVPPGDTGLASGLFGTSRQIGGALGLAAIGTVVWGTVAARSHGADVGAAARRALAAGVDRGFVVAAVIVALAAVLVLVTVPGRERAA